MGDFVDCRLDNTVDQLTPTWGDDMALQKLHTGLQASWILCLSTLPLVFRTLNYTFMWKEKHWAAVQSFLMSSPVQEWLNIRNAKVVAAFLETYWHQPQSTLCKVAQVLELIFLTIPLRLQPSLLFVQNAINMLWSSTLRTARRSATTSCGFPSLWSVSEIIWRTVQSSL